VTIWHQNILPDPQSPASQRLAELFAARSELRKQEREARTEAQAAIQEKADLDQQLQKQEARATAFGDEGNLKALRAQATKIAATTKRHEEQADKLM
jgi:hypothetical protein